MKANHLTLTGHHSQCVQSSDSSTVQHFIQTPHYTILTRDAPTFPNTVTDTCYVRSKQTKRYSETKTDLKTTIFPSSTCSRHSKTQVSTSSNATLPVEYSVEEEDPQADDEKPMADKEDTVADNEAPLSDDEKPLFGSINPHTPDLSSDVISQQFSRSEDRAQMRHIYTLLMRTSRQDPRDEAIKVKSTLLFFLFSTQHLFLAHTYALYYNLYKNNLYCVLLSFVML